MKKLLFLLLIAVAIISCENSVDVGPYGQSALKTLTFNTKLDKNGYSNLFAERKTTILQKLTETDADIICLQEVWSADDMKKVHEAMNAADDDFYLLYSTTGETGGDPVEPACSNSEVLPIGMCYQQNCQDQTGTGALLCLAQQCGTEFQNLSPECRDCMLAEGQTGNLDLQAIMDACMDIGGDTPKEEESTNGLILISRFPMKSKSIIALPSDQIPRQYISATLQTQGILGNIDVVCTQLSNADDGTRADTLRTQQVDSIITFFNKNRAKNIQLLMGDFDSSPETEMMPAHNAAVWAKLKDALFQNAWQSDPFCTVCQDNPQIKATVKDWDIMPEYAADHIFYRPLQNPLFVSTFRTCEDSAANKSYTKSTSISSHYGVSAILAPYPLEQ
ncbi:endonuclease/exonuclease/phosphatase family protein [bacterium]|nr:endonuclease/exonuclease/phosphatase family protein [bacterium]